MKTLKSLKREAGFLGALGTAGASVLSAGISGLFGNYQAGRQMDFQSAQAATQHQREVADLRAAGLNPILSGTGGAGAAAPGGAMAQTPDFLGSAVQASRLEAEVENIKAQTDLTKAKEGAITPVSKTGDLIGDLMDWVEKQAAPTARSIQRAVDKYYQDKSIIRKGVGPRRTPLRININKSQKDYR